MLRLTSAGAARILAVAGLSLVGLTSCRTLAGGQGGAQAVTINTVSRTYNRSMDEVWHAVNTALKELDLRIQEDQHDALGGQITAQRANKDSVVVEARSVDAQTLQVSVAVDPGDRNMAQIVQDRIADVLAGGGGSRGAPRGAAPSTPRVEGTYPQPLEACVAGARRAAESLKLTNVMEEVRDTSARVEGRHNQTLPVTFRMSRAAQGQTHVVFDAGAGGTAADDGRGVADRLKAEFERNLR